MEHCRRDGGEGAQVPLEAALKLSGHPWELRERVAPRPTGWPPEPEKQSITQMARGLTIPVLGEAVAME